MAATITLATINKTLQRQTDVIVEQTKASERMATSIDDVREQITRMIESQMSTYDTLENLRERPEFDRPSSPGMLPPPGQQHSNSTGELAGITSMQNLINNIIGGVAGGVMSGAFGARLAGGVIGLMGRGLKWGLIAFAADQILNAVFENFDVPTEMARELQGDTRRGLFAAGTAALLGLRGKWMLIASAAGFFYDEANKLVNWITENSEAARAAMQWFEEKTGIPATPLVSTAVAAGGTLLAYETAKRLGGKAVSLASRGIRASPQLMTHAAGGLWNTAKATAPAVVSTAKAGLKSAYGYGMRGLSAVGTIGTAPLAGLAGTVALLGASTSEYKQMLQDYPEMAPMNNGAGPGLVRGKYLIESGSIDEAIEYEKQQGTYQDRPKYQTTREVPQSLTTPDSTLPFLEVPDTGALMDYLNSSGRAAPIVRNDDMSAIADYLNSVESKPQVVVVPVPSPSPPTSKGGGGGAAVFTAPVGTIDRLDHRDRITRPW